MMAGQQMAGGMVSQEELEDFGTNLCKVKDDTIRSKLQRLQINQAATRALRPGWSHCRGNKWLKNLEITQYCSFQRAVVNHQLPPGVAVDEGVARISALRTWKKKRKHDGDL